MSLPQESRLRDVANALLALPYGRRIMVFGSVATGGAAPKDLDVFIDLRPETTSQVQPGAYGKMIAIARDHYGWLDPFLLCQDRIWCRNDQATGWTISKNGRAMRQAMLTQGQPLWLAAAVPKPELEQPFIGYLGAGGQFECFAHSVARQADYHHSFLVKDLDAYSSDGSLSFVRMDAGADFTVRGDCCHDPYSAAARRRLGDLAQRLVALGADPESCLKVDDMQLPRAESPYQGKNLGTLRRWILEAELVPKPVASQPGLRL